LALESGAGKPDVAIKGAGGAAVEESVAAVDALAATDGMVLAVLFVGRLEPAAVSPEAVAGAAAVAGVPASTFTTRKREARAGCSGEEGFVEGALLTGSGSEAV
jgi:hypothetical protein